MSATAEVFISYSSEDRDKIAPIVQLVRSLKNGLVFQDYANILPGERWRERVMGAITQATTLLVFWCEHSAASEHVREEYQAGIESQKDVVPILLDDTELPPVLSAFHWIDLRRPEGHGGLTSFAYRAFQRSPRRHYYPTDKHGEYRDWELEQFNEEERDRKRAWDESQAPLRNDVAHTIVAQLFPEQM
jgi:hypothetical protein